MKRGIFVIVMCLMLTVPALTWAVKPLKLIDADTLDGLDSTEFAFLIHTHDSSQITGPIDANTFNGFGITDFAPMFHTHGISDISGPIDADTLNGASLSLLYSEFAPLSHVHPEYDPTNHTHQEISDNTLAINNNSVDIASLQNANLKTRTEIVPIAPTMFQHFEKSCTEKYTIYSQYIRNPGSDVNCIQFLAPVQLPQGSKIVSMTSKFTDLASGTTDDMVLLRFFRYEPILGTTVPGGDTLAINGSHDTSVIDQKTVPINPGTEIVDNKQFTYVLYLNIPRNDLGRFFGGYIVYEYSID